MNKLIIDFPCIIKYQGKEYKAIGLLSPYYGEGREKVDLYYMCQDGYKNILLDPTGVDGYETPSKLDYYWYISLDDGVYIISLKKDIGSATDMWRRESLNYFESQEQAEMIISKIEFAKQ